MHLRVQPCGTRAAMRPHHNNDFNDLTHCTKWCNHLLDSARDCAEKPQLTSLFDHSGELELVLCASAELRARHLLDQVLQQLAAEVLFVRIERFDEVEADVKEIIRQQVALLAQ